VTPEDFDFFAPETVVNPWAMYAVLRRDAPVYRIFEPAMRRDVYVVTPFDLVQQVFADNELYSSRHGDILLAGGGNNPDVEAILSTGWPEIATLQDNDQPDHRRFRVLANKAFSPANVTRMTSFVGGVIDELIDGFIERGECDFIREFSVPLPTLVILGILGFDRSMAPKFAIWADAFVTMISHMGTREEEINAAHHIVEFQNHAWEKIKASRVKPGDDMISALIQAKDEEGAPSLTDHEILSLVRQIMIAGSETTRNTTSAGIGALLRNPDQLALLASDKSLLPAAMDEMLRYFSPVSGMWRIATRDTVLGGVQIPKDGLVMLRIDSANHDETMFADPLAFNIRRPNLRRHMAFGFGIHFCLGAMLARKEISEALPRLISRLHEMEIIEEKTDLGVFPILILRAPKALHIRFRRGTRLSAEPA